MRVSAELRGALLRGQGKTTPRLWTRPLRELTPETSHGFHVIEFAARFLGITLRPWQQWLLIHALELTPDGRYRFRKVIIIVGRQNGKTKLIEVLALWWLFVDSDSFPDHVPADEFLVLGTAQDKDTAKKVWRKVLRRCNPNVLKWPSRFSPAEREAIVPPLVSQSMPPAESNGSEAIILKNGAQYQIAASTSGGARGDSISRAVLDELREQKNWEGWAALSKTLNGTFNSQLWAISSAGDARSVVLKDLRDAAIDALKEWDEYVTRGILSAEEYANDHDTSIGLFEWSAPEGCPLDDPDAYLQSNPSIGYGYEVEALLSDLESGEPEVVTRTEVLCQWVESMVIPFMDGDAWLKATDAPRVDEHGVPVAVGSQIAEDSHMVIGIDTSWNRSMTYVSVAGYRDDGLMHVEIVRMRAGMLWVVPEVQRIAAEQGIKHVAVQSRGCPAADFVQPLKDAGLEVVEIFGTTMLNSAGRLRDRVRDELLRHRGQPILDLAMVNGIAKQLSGIDVWDRAGSVVDVAPAVAVTNAVLGLETTEKAQPVLSAYAVADGEETKDWW